MTEPGPPRSDLAADQTQFAVVEGASSQEHLRGMAFPRSREIRHSGTKGAADDCRRSRRAAWPIAESDCCSHTTLEPGSATSRPLPG
jgi:hypothetical protein